MRRVPNVLASVAIAAALVGSSTIASTTAPAQKAEPAADKSQDTVAQPELRAELLRRVEDDQKARTALMKWMKQAGTTAGQVERESADKVIQQVGRIDRENTRRLREIVDQFGWPGKGLVGVDGAHAAWLLLQHADHDLEFQKKGLDLMMRAPAGEVSMQDVAYLTDRVSIKEKEKQVYGTQVHLVNGSWEPQPLVDPEKVDQRRAEVGLPPLADYLKLVEEMYSAQSAQSAKSDKQ
jgi:hypothetical protein